MSLLGSSSYRIATRVGEGAHGSVYTTIHEKTGSIYATKKILKCPTDMYWIENEVKNIQKVQDCENIVKLHEVIDTTDAVYIVQDLCKGGSLYQHMMSNTRLYSEHEVASIISRILDALACCYVNDIVFSDLKPKNIVYYSTENISDIRLVDFGSSQSCADGDTLHKDLCTPVYAAPEVFHGCFDKKSDMWSCGVLMFVLLTRRYPFWMNGFKEVDHVSGRYLCKGILRNDVLFPEGMSDNAKDLLSVLLNRDASKRPTPFQALKHPWFEQALGYQPKTTFQAQPNLFLPQ